MTEKKDIVDCRDCVHYGKLECLDCECANLFEKRKVEIAMTRQDAIDYNKNLKMYMKISDQHNPCKFLEENYIALDMAIEALKEQRQHGEWICKGAVGNGTWCSVCDTNIKLFPNRYSFCPTCGADMRKEGEAE